MVDGRRRGGRRGRTRGDRRTPADPVQRAQAEVARTVEEHRQLKQRAANVIADQKLAELQVRRALEDHDALHERIRATVALAEETTRRGGADAGARHRRETEVLAAQLVDLAHEIDERDRRWARATDDADATKAAVRAHTVHLRAVVAERDRVVAAVAAGRPPDRAPILPPPPTTPGPRTIESVAVDDDPSRSPARPATSGEVRRAELRALLGVPAPGARRPAPGAEGDVEGPELPPPYPTGFQPHRPETPPRR